MEGLTKGMLVVVGCRSACRWEERSPARSVGAFSVWVSPDPKRKSWHLEVGWWTCHMPRMPCPWISQGPYTTHLRIGLLDVYLARRHRPDECAVKDNTRNSKANYPAKEHVLARIDRWRLSQRQLNWTPLIRLKGAKDVCASTNAVASYDAVRETGNRARSDSCPWRTKGRTCS